MEGEWKRVTIDQLKASIPNAIAMGPFGSRIKAENFVDSGVPVIRGSNLNALRLLDEDFVYLTEEKADELKASNARPGDIVITHRGTLGQVGIIPSDARYPRYVVSQSQMKLTLDASKADALFVLYFLRSPDGQHQLLANTSQVGVPAIAQPTSAVKTIEVPVPPTLDIQRAIAYILGTIDDKIELNRRMSETLEALARAIFKSWFVDFDPVRAKASGEPPESICRRLRLTRDLLALFPDRLVDSELGEIPDGWAVKPLDEIAGYLNGLALQKYPPESETEWLPVIKIAQLRSGSTVGADRASHRLDPEYVVDDGDVLFSWSGSLEVDIWCAGRGALNQHLFKVTSEDYPKWFYLHWTREHLPHFRTIAAGKAVTMGHIQRKHLTEALCVVPDGALLSAGDEIVAPLCQALVEHRRQARTLAATRDTLLPKLLSGEVRVPREGDA